MRRTSCSIPPHLSPKRVAQMTVNSNRNALDREVGPDGMRDCSFKLFDYKSARRLYTDAWLYPCVVYSKNKQRLRHLEDQGTPLPGGGERYSHDCRAFVCLSFLYCWWYPTCSNRSDIRKRYGIRGRKRDDCFVSFCFTPCALAQERRELELEEETFD